MHDSQGPILSARGVVKTYRTGTNEVHALRGIDLDVRSGELLMIMGPSGNGKTTLLNCLSGLDDIDAGTVTVDGDDLFAMSDGARTRHRANRMGFVFQFFNLIPVLSARENVELPLLVTGVAPKQAHERARDMLARVGLADRADHRPGELSGGEQQRVTVARALVAEPALVWADEPTGALDSQTAGEIVELLHEVHAAGQTHVIRETLSLGDVNVQASATSNGIALTITNTGGSVQLNGTVDPRTRQVELELQPRAEAPPTQAAWLRAHLIPAPGAGDTRYAIRFALPVR